MRRFKLVYSLTLFLFIITFFVILSCQEDPIEEVFECSPPIDEEKFYFFGYNEAEIYNYDDMFWPIDMAGLIGPANIKLNNNETFELSFKLEYCDSDNSNTIQACMFFDSLDTDKIILKGNWSYWQRFKNLNKLSKYPNRDNPREENERIYLTGRIVFEINEAPIESLVGIHGTGIYHKTCDSEEFQIYLPIYQAIDLRIVISPPGGDPDYDLCPDCDFDFF